RDQEIVEEQVLAPVAPLELGERLRLAQLVGEHGVDRARAQQRRVGREVDARRKQRIDEAGGVADERQARPPERRVAVGEVLADAHLAVWAFGYARGLRQQIAD